MRYDILIYSVQDYMYYLLFVLSIVALPKTFLYYLTTCVTNIFLVGHGITYVIYLFDFKGAGYHFIVFHNLQWNRSWLWKSNKHVWGAKQ